jgi:hypothetical protein
MLKLLHSSANTGRMPPAFPLSGAESIRLLKILQIPALASRSASWSSQILCLLKSESSVLMLIETVKSRIYDLTGLVYYGLFPDSVQ